MLTRTQKEESVAELREKLARATSVFVADYRGLSVAAGGRAARQAARGGRRSSTRWRRTRCCGVPSADSRRGGARPTASRGRRRSRSRSATRCALAKVLVDYAKENEQVHSSRAASWTGGRSAPAEIATIATLPSLDELRGKLVGLLQAPAQKLAALLVGAGRAARPASSRRGAASSRNPEGGAPRRLGHPPAGGRRARTHRQFIRKVEHGRSQRNRRHSSPLSP